MAKEGHESPLGAWKRKEKFSEEEHNISYATKEAIWSSIVEKVNAVSVTRRTVNQGPGTEDRPRCRVCTAEYHLQKGSAWRLVACRWQIWIICTVAFALFAIVPFVVYRMMTAFRNPPPHPLFKAAAVCFGLLTETLLIKFLVCYCSRSYGSAKMSSFSVRARTVERCDAGFSLLWPVAAGQNSSTAVGSGGEERKQEVLMASEGLGLKLCV